MCGIAGSFHAPDWCVSDALEAIAHRGPDARGITQCGEVFHGHVRLSIQDPHPRSNQPFEYRDTLCSFVGEVWNWRTIREMLEGVDYEFETEGDTEVVAAALNYWGEKALAMLDGMFAVAWTEVKTDRTYVARDRYGKVPLYLLEEGYGGLFGSGVLWASERKAFGKRGGEAIPVPAGTSIELSVMKPRAFYDLAKARDQLAEWPRRRERDYYANSVLYRLRTGTHRRLMADVPVCCLISGGLDSAMTVKLVSEVKPDVVAYTAYSDEASPDLAAARSLCREWGIPLREVAVAPSGLEDRLREAIWAIETPMKAQVEIATLCLPLAAQIAADGFKVCLSGEGADELFGGYGGLQRKATSDRDWKDARLASWEKQARGNFLRVNKAFMAYGVEARVPFAEQGLVELALGLGLESCPPRKGLLKDAARKLGIPDDVIDQEKRTFQGASGMQEALDEELRGAQTLRYNDMARDIFGGLPRG